MRVEQGSKCWRSAKARARSESAWAECVVVHVMRARRGGRTSTNRRRRADSRRPSVLGPVPGQLKGHVFVGSRIRQTPRSHQACPPKIQMGALTACRPRAAFAAEHTAGSQLPSVLAVTVGYPVALDRAREAQADSRTRSAEGFAAADSSRPDRAGGQAEPWCFSRCSPRRGPAHDCMRRMTRHR